MALLLVSASRKKICFHSGSLTSYFNYIKQQATVSCSFMLSGIPVVPTRNKGSKCWSLGDNTGITLSLSFLLRKTSKGKISAKHKFLAMELQSDDQKRWSLPGKPTNQLRQVCFMPVSNSLTFVLAQILMKSQHDAWIKGLTLYFSDIHPKQGE